MASFALGRKGPDPTHKKNQFALIQPCLAHWQAPQNINYLYLYKNYPDNQMQKPWCVAFAGAQLHELKLRRHAGVDIRYSRRGLYNLTKMHFEGGDFSSEGLYTADMLQTLAQFGAPLETDWPEKLDVPNSEAEPVPASLINTAHPLTDFVRVTPTVDDLVLAMACAGPIVSGWEWHEDWFSPLIDENGEAWLTPTPTQGVAGGHDFDLVGYSKTKKHQWGVGAMAILNQWGPEWAKNSTAWIPFCTQVLPDDAYTVAL